MADSIPVFRPRNPQPKGGIILRKTACQGSLESEKPTARVARATANRPAGQPSRASSRGCSTTFDRRPSCSRWRGPCLKTLWNNRPASAKPDRSSLTSQLAKVERDIERFLDRIAQTEPLSSSRFRRTESAGSKSERSRSARRSPIAPKRGI